MLLDLLSSGMTTDEIMADYPDLEEKDIQASLVFATKLIKVNSINTVLAA